MSSLDFLFLFYVVAFLPYLVIKGTVARKSRTAPLPPKERAIWSTIISLALIGALAVLRAYGRGTPLFVPWKPTEVELATGCALLLTLVQMRYLLRFWMKKSQNPDALYLRPKSWSDMPLWTLLSCCAGFFEEIVYRGVLYQILLGMTGSVAVAVALACLVFGLVHLRQGYRAAIFITVLSASLHWLVIRFGNLYMAMLVHAAYDVIAGVTSVMAAQKRSALLPD